MSGRARPWLLLEGSLSPTTILQLIGTISPTGACKCSLASWGFLFSSVHTRALQCAHVGCPSHEAQVFVS